MYCMNSGDDEQYSEIQSQDEKYKTGAEQTRTSKKLEVGSGAMELWTSSADQSYLPCAPDNAQRSVLLCSCFIFLFWTFDLEQILQLAVSKVGCVLSFPEAHATLKSLNKLLLHSSLHDHRHLVGEPFCFPSDTISCPVESYFFVFFC